MDLPHWSALPWGMWRQAELCRARGEAATIMDPGGAVPEGAMGYVSAGIELAQQVAAGQLPLPRTVVVAVGSNCTTAGLIVGFAMAARLGIGFEQPPRLCAVRVTPWPVTSRWRVLSLARRTARLLAQLLGEPELLPSRAELAAAFELDVGHIGPGYGFATDAGREAIQLWQQHAGHALETTYSGKAAAAVLARVRSGHRGPLLYWATKSSAPLAAIDRDRLAWAPARMRRWMKSTRAAISPKRG